MKSLSNRTLIVATFRFPIQKLIATCNALLQLMQYASNDLPSQTQELG